jgi:hypothetical protein
MIDPIIYIMEYNKDNLREAVDCAFHYVESYDHIVGTIYSSPDLIKALVLKFSNEVKFDYIHQGIGTFRTAYLKYLPIIRRSEYLFVNREETFRLRLKLI